MSIYIPNYAVVYTRVVSYALKVVELDLYISHFIISSELGHMAMLKDVLNS